jgi:DNA-binding NarL/FixJ family response regulator
MISVQNRARLTGGTFSRPLARAPPPAPASPLTAMRNRLLIADDHALMLEGLTRLLAAEFEVVGSVTNGRALLSEAERLRPDVIVIDIGMPEMNGIEAARRLTKSLPSARLVVVTQQLDPAYLHAAFSAGVKAYVAKQSAARELLLAIHTALRNHYYVTPLAGQQAAQATALDPHRNPAGMFGARLTPRQREVLQLVAEGKTTMQISALLKISPKTVEFHRNSLMDELGVRTTAELTRYALSRGIVNQ